MTLKIDIIKCIKSLTLFQMKKWFLNTTDPISGFCWSMNVQISFQLYSNHTFTSFILLRQKWHLFCYNHKWKEEYNWISKFKAYTHALIYCIWSSIFPNQTDGWIWHSTTSVLLLIERKLYGICIYFHRFYVFVFAINLILWDAALSKC